MSALPIPLEIEALQIGALARQCLVPGVFGRVLASFSQAVYLQAESGEIFWLASAGAPMHRRCLQVHAPLPFLQSGSAFSVSGPRLAFDGLVLDTTFSSEWDAPDVDPSCCAPVARQADCLRQLLAGPEFTRPRGLGAFLLDIFHLAGLGCTYQSSSPGEPVLTFMRPRLMEMARACLDHRPAEAVLLAGSLVGLGPGLTPSGDDFLGGLLFCMHALRQLYGGWQFPTTEIPLASYSDRTHPISFSILKDLAAGHAIAPLHEIFNRLVCAAEASSMQPSLSQLLSLGHSTGWDLLTGLLTGLLVIIPGCHETPARSASVLQA